MKIRIYLDHFWYAGQDIGENWQFDFTINGKRKRITRNVPYGGQWDTYTLLYLGVIDDDVTLPVRVEITEIDPVYNDFGRAETTWDIDYGDVRYFTSFNPSIHSMEHYFQATVPGDPRGDPDATAQVAFKLIAIFEPCNKGERVVGNRVEKPGSRKSKGTFEVPALTPPDNVGKFIKDLLEAAGDPGNIADQVDTFFSLNSVYASGAYDLWEVFAAEMCDEIWECVDGEFKVTAYENCEEVTHQVMKEALSLPAGVDVKQLMVQHLAAIWNEVNN